MAQMPIEITELGDFPAGLINRSMDIANRAQGQFLYLRLDEVSASKIRMISFREIHTDEILPELRRIKSALPGYHPFITAFTKAKLTGAGWSNLFCDRIRGSGISIASTYGLEGDIIPTGKLLSYLVYYHAKNALCFLAPDHESHQETRSCVFDFMKDKQDLLLSMRTGSICDNCRRRLLEETNELAPQQFEALDTLFGEAHNLIISTSKPRVFVGSSTEGLSVAKKIQSELQHDYSVEMWNQGTVFGLGRAAIEALESAVLRYDFGVFVFTPDDEILHRHSKRRTARDNVVFELGLFVGKIGRHRAFIVHPWDKDMRLPSDLKGVIAATYDSASESLAAALGPACEKIRLAIEEALGRK